MPLGFFQESFGVALSSRRISIIAILNNDAASNKLWELRADEDKLEFPTVSQFWKDVTNQDFEDDNWMADEKSPWIYIFGVVFGFKRPSDCLANVA
ncbi:hypothetical protein O1611_g10228 [Lasiodiplodia mahajangana]|uniref:Uncharacterized protein n=1 Tax=Lasiodiplodia mahajangana TaxID=1108764 RepID=A0ACC2J0G5_9PEZI|nr:hypothetical protein O1611_g10228 [Lasiodiplodia mahajangana]